MNNGLRGSITARKLNWKATELINDMKYVR